MEKCPKCGNKLSPVDVLCPRCGALVEVIHVAPHPDAVSSENSGLVISHKPRPADTAGQDDSSALPDSVAEKEAMPLSQQSVQPVISPEEDDLPMSRQARKAALRTRQTKGTQPDAVQDSGESTTRKWLELEEVDLSNPVIANESMLEDDAADATNEKPLATNEDLPVQTPETLADDDALLDDTPRRYRRRSADEAESEPRKQVLRRRSPIALILLMWVVIAGAVFGAFYFLDTHVTSTYGGWDDFVRQISNGKIELDTSASYLNSIQVEINETQTEDGAPAHRFDITMSSAKSIKVLPLGDSFDMNNGAVSFAIADEDLARTLGTVSSDPTIDTSDVSLEITTPTETFTYPVDSLTLKLTDAVYAREAPAELTSTEETVQIAMKVSPDAVVFINNANHATEIDDNGRLSVSMPLDMGENLFVIEVIQPGRRSIKESFTVSREDQRTSLAPATDYLRVYESPFECQGTTDPGATITATMGEQSFTALVAADGTFSLACKAEEIGMNELTIKASSEGHSDAEAAVAVEYLPEPNAFMADAKALSVAKMVKDLDSLGETGIKAEGIVEKLTSEANKQSFELTSGKDSINCYYYGTVQLSQSSSYTFFGIADAERDSFYVMFVV